MKKCPKCGKTYDDSWGVCLADNSRLDAVSPEKEEQAKREIVLPDINYEKLREMTTKLGRFFIVVRGLIALYIIAFVVTFPLVAPNIEKINLKILYTAIGMVVAVFLIVNHIFFRKIRSVYRLMGEGGFVMGYFTWIAPYYFGSDVISRAKALLKDYNDVKAGKKVLLKK